MSWSQTLNIHNGRGGGGNRKGGGFKVIHFVHSGGSGGNVCTGASFRGENVELVCRLVLSCHSGPVSAAGTAQHAV